MENLIKFMQGKKTFFVCILMVVYALSGVILGQLDGGEAVTLLLEAAALAGLRVGVGSGVKKKKK